VDARRVVREEPRVSGRRTWRFGVVGTGAMSVAMMACLAASRRVSVTAVASADAGRARDFASRFGIAQACHGLAQLLERTDVDAVYIATSTRDHADHAIAALAAGKAVLCEKPFATSVEQGLRVQEAARLSGRLFMEAQWTTALPAYRALLRLARDPSLGRPVALSSEFGLALDPAAHPRLFEGEGAGVLLDFGVYPVVLALQLLGPVRSVSAAVVRDAAGIDVHASLQLVHANGSHAQLAVSLVAALPNRTTLSCTHGNVQGDSPVMGAESLLRRVVPRPSVPSSGRGGAAGRLVSRLRRHRFLRRLRSALAGGERIELPFGADRYAPQLEHFVSLLDAGVRASPLMPLETSLEVLRILEAARFAPETIVTP
jgi:predicted dehydrogenase